MFLYTLSISLKSYLTPPLISTFLVHAHITLQNSLFTQIPTYIILELTLLISFTYIYIRTIISNNTPSLISSSPHPRFSSSKTSKTHLSLPPPTFVSFKPTISNLHSSYIAPISSLFPPHCTPLRLCTPLSTTHFCFLKEQVLRKRLRGGTLHSCFAHNPV